MKKRDLYILLTDTGTLLSRMVRQYTKEPLNHVSLAFDPELKEVYSFGRRKPENMFYGGFVRENVYGGIFINHRRSSKCAIYRLVVSEAAYRRIRQQIRWFEEHQDELKYNFLGLFAVMLKKKWERKNKFFCSQFVTTVLQDNGIRLVNKPPFFTTPGDFRKCEALELIFEGYLSEYLFNRASLLVSDRYDRIPFSLTNYASKEGTP